jgi:hypothetical protein
MNEFLEYFKPEGVSLAFFAAQLVFSIIGSTIRLTIDVRQGIAKATKSPGSFDALYFLKDNSLRIALGLPAMYALVYFADFLVPSDSRNMAMLGGLVIGLFSDLIVRLVDKGLRGKINELYLKYFGENKPPVS